MDTTKCDFGSPKHDINTCPRCTAGNKMPEGQGKRDIKRPRHDLIPIEFLDELAGIFEEGRKPRPGFPEGYGDSWKQGGDDFLLDCLNHASNHLHNYMSGNHDENHLAKVAWNVLAVKYHTTKHTREMSKDSPIINCIPEHSKHVFVSNQNSVTGLDCISCRFPRNHEIHVRC